MTIDYIQEEYLNCFQFQEKRNENKKSSKPIDACGFQYN